MAILNVYDKETEQYIGFPAIVGPPGSPGKNGFGNNNLFINPYFVGAGNDNKFPINQDGLTSWSEAGYTIDGWIIDGGSAERTSDGMILHTESGAIAYSQRLETIALNRDFTAAILADGVLYSATGKFPDKGGQEVTWTNKYGDIAITAKNPSAGFPEVFFHFPSKSTTTNCTAACLELGTEQTGFKLLNDAWVVNELPDYGEHLARCQRYLAICNDGQHGYGHGYSTGSITITIPTVQPLRTTPSIYGSGNFTVYWPAKSSYIDTSTSTNYALVQTGVRVTCFNTGVKEYNPIVAIAPKLILSARL